jgi:hypothetical protein
MPKPSVSRAVHYVSYGTPGGEYASQCRAATITEVAPGQDAPVGLCVQNPTGLFFHSLADGGVAQDETNKRGGTWHWPERTTD